MATSAPPCACRTAAGSSGAGVDDEVGAEVLGELQLLVSDVDGGDGAAEDLRVLQCQVDEAADAGDVLGVAAVDRVAGVLLAEAERLPAGEAVLALAACVAEPGIGNCVADAEAGDTQAYCVDGADAFMAGHEWRGGLHWPVAVRGVDIRVAQAGGLHLHGDLARSWFGYGSVLDNERLAELPYNCCSPSDPSTRGAAGPKCPKSLPARLSALSPRIGQSARWHDNERANQEGWRQSS